MKIYLILFLIIITNNQLKCQDVIILKNGDSIKCKIIEDKITYLTFKFFKTDTTIQQIDANKFDYYIKKEIEETTETTPVVIPKIEEKTNYLIYTEPLKRGAYMSKDEFLNNNPSIDFAFEIKQRSKFSIVMVGGNDYKVIILDKNIKRKQVKKKFWGICDGKNCYINCFRESKLNHYSILTIEKDRAFFKALPTAEERASFAGVATFFFGGVIGGIIAAKEALVRYLYCYDYKTGIIFLQERK